MQPSKDTLAFSLFILKEAREQLAQDFIEEEPEIYRPMFQYEKSKEQMVLAKEKYMVSWLDSHWELIENFLQNQELENTIQDGFRSGFAVVLLRLLEKFNKDGVSPVSVSLLKEKVRNLEELLNLGDKHEDRFNKLRYDIERHKRIFARKIDELRRKTK